MKYLEHVAFLLFWICRFLVCCRSKKVTRAYLAVVVALTTEQEIALGSFILSHIFKDINDLGNFNKVWKLF